VAITTMDVVARVERGQAIPNAWYTDAAVLDLEREHVLSDSWQQVEAR
jgi:hypothetical protein